MHSTKYLIDLQSTLTTSDYVRQALFALDPLSNSMNDEYLNRLDQELQTIVNSLYESLGYSGAAVVTGIPQLFIDADPDIMKSFDIEEDGFEIMDS